MNEKKGTAPQKISLAIIICLAVFLASLIAYLAVSFALSAWSTSWLIWIGAATICTIIISAFVIAAFGKKGKYTLPRICIAASIAMVFVLVFLCLLTLTDLQKMWIILLIMVIAIVGADTVTAYWVGAKGRLVNLIAFILVATSLEYVILSLVDLITWHPYWLIPVAGVVLSIIIVAIKIRQVLVKSKSDAAPPLAEIENTPSADEASAAQENAPDQE